LVTTSSIPARLGQRQKPCSRCVGQSGFGNPQQTWRIAYTLPLRVLLCQSSRIIFASERREAPSHVPSTVSCVASRIAWLFRAPCCRRRLNDLRQQAAHHADLLATSRI